MFATIRRYRPTAGKVDRQVTDELRRQLQEEFVPIAQRIPGFHGYYAFTVEDRELLTVSVYEDRSGAEESTRRAMDYTRNTKMPIEVGQPEVIEGEVLAFAEAHVGAH
jgi:hypothetical protein